MAHDQENPLRCPSCGARDVRPSLPRGMWDALMKALGRRPMRCRQCQRRFHPHASEVPESQAQL